MPSNGEGAARVGTLDPTEAELWGRLMAEFRQHDQAAKILVYQMQAEKRKYEQTLAELERRRQVELARAKEVREHYEQVTAEFCAKYRVDRQYAVIDVEGRVIREERPAPTATT